MSGMWGFIKSSRNFACLYSGVPTIDMTGLSGTSDLCTLAIPHNLPGLLPLGISYNLPGLLPLGIKKHNPKLNTQLYAGGHLFC